MKTALSTADLIAVFLGYRFTVSSEDDLQRAIAAALEKAGVPFEREVRLTPRERIDFLSGGVGIECKIGGSPGNLARQVRRYCEHEDVDQVLVVTNQPSHASLPDHIEGKPVVVLNISEIK